MYYGYQNSQYQLYRDSMNEFGKARLDKQVGRRLPYILASTLAVAVGNGIVGELLASRGPAEDEDWGSFLLRKALLQSLQTIPVVRDLARGIEFMIEGHESFNASPMASALEAAYRAIAHVPDLFGDDEEQFAAAGGILGAAATLRGVPGASQARTTIGALWDNGLPWDPDAPDFLDYVHDLAYPRRKEERR